MGLLLQEALRHGHAARPGTARPPPRRVPALRRPSRLLTDGRRAALGLPPPRGQPAPLRHPVARAAARRPRPGPRPRRPARLLRARGSRFLAIGAGIAARELARAPARRRAATRRPTRSSPCCTATPWASIEAGERAARPRGQLRAVDGRAAAGDPLHGPRPRPATPRSTPRSRAACRGCSRSAARSRTRACATSPSATGTATGSAASMLWGDTFPHHWSALTANVLLLLPEAVAAAFERDRGEPPAATARRHPRRQPRSTSPPTAARPRRSCSRAACPAAPLTAPTRSPTTRTGRSTGRCCSPARVNVNGGWVGRWGSGPPGCSRPALTARSRSFVLSRSHRYLVSGALTR